MGGLCVCLCEPVCVLSFVVCAWLTASAHPGRRPFLIPPPLPPPPHRPIAASRHRQDPATRQPRGRVEITAQIDPPAAAPAAPAPPEKGRLAIRAVEVADVKATAAGKTAVYATVTLGKWKASTAVTTMQVRPHIRPYISPYLRLELSPYLMAVTTMQVPPSPFERPTFVPSRFRALSSSPSLF